MYHDYLLIEEHQFQPGPYGYDRTFGYLWDPIAGMASRPLMMLDYQNNSFFYTHDANKNITELVDDSGKIVTHYEYSPFGAITLNTNPIFDNKFSFSSEYSDVELGLVYYNYRHYNSMDGRWISRDPIEEKGGFNLYCIVNNNAVLYFDTLGNNRYFTRDNLGHVGVAVDTWECRNGEWIKTGTMRYDFGPQNACTGLFFFKGEITCSNKPLNLVDIVKTGPCEDVEMRKKMEEDMASPPTYNVLFYNCRDWARQAFLYGLLTDEEKFWWSFWQSDDFTFYMRCK